MSTNRKKNFADAASGIDNGLNALFETLGDALTTMLNRVEDGHTGSVHRDQVFETNKGPIRAHAGIKLRMGGLDATEVSDQAKPVNPARPTASPEAPKAKPIIYDVMDDNDDWIITADLPGVANADLAFDQDRTTLLVMTTGTRLYEGRIDLDSPFSLTEISSQMRNGILTLRIKKGQ